jgi:beta-lactamase class A
MSESLKKNLLIVSKYFAFFIAGFILSGLHIHLGKYEIESQAYRAGPGEFKYINPLLLCNINENKEFEEFSKLNSSIDKVSQDFKQRKVIDSGSVYFRDLSTGQWTGINENDLYNPASLLKVPILIAYLKQAEKTPNLLNQEYFYEQIPGQAPPLVGNPILKSGKYYKVEDLLRGMIIDSDNTATIILENKIDKKFLTGVYSELGITSPYLFPDQYQISTRTYALFFRVLYNATFLSHEMSEKALSILSEVKFDKGLKSGVPKGVIVADKYGYSILKKETPRSIELSDCGITYDKKKPYILCVMAKGSDPDQTAEYIKEVAKTTNDLVKSGI